MPLNGRYNLVVVDLAEKKPLVLTRFEKGDVLSMFWANDERLLYTTGDQQGLELYGDGGLFAVNRDGANPRTLVEPVVGWSSVAKFVFRMTTVVRRIKDAPEEVLVSANDRNADSQDIYRMNILTGRKSLLSFESPGQVLRWAVDSDLQPRATMSIDARQRRFWSALRGADGKGWRTIAEWDENLKDVIIPAAFAPRDPKLLYVASNVGRDTLAYFKYDTEAMKLGEMVAGTERYDLASFLLIGAPLGEGGGLIFAGPTEEDPQQLVGLRAALDRTTTVWFDEEAAKLQRTVDAAVPGAVNTFDPFRKRSLVSSRSSVQPGVYYWFDRDKRQLEDTGINLRPWIDPALMAPMQAVSWTARDGMKIDGYLTLPKHYKKGSPVPLILHPHGGPWAKDNWEWNPEVQFMANRGFAVLQPNFRGSTGYGAKHLRASYKHWGDTMIDDMLDGVQWTIDQGYVDKDRIGVYGASYGGYATLMCLVRRPDLFKWGINYVGVSDMFVHQDTQPAQKYGNFTEMAKVINGDQRADRALFEATSPTLQVGKIAVPVFHAYGGQDRNVDIANGNAIKAAFDKAGKQQEWMFVADEAHGYRQDKNVFEFYSRFEAFILAHTPKKA
ncbi:MAG: S9 family peptidase [Burkholderiales bacterium]|nr:S9 family peptidase [Burkholderiales bacterium]